MPPTMEEQINQLKGTIAEMEAQRSVLGDDFVDSTLETLRDKLADLEANAEMLTQWKETPLTRQRKLVTLLYLDVVGSTAMTQHLDPEDTLEIMENALLRLAAPIKEHGGRVTRYTGDGFKAVFGGSIARESDPEQAIHAGLKILELSQELAQEIEKDWEIEYFKVRIGIDTGLAALGGQTEGENTVKGRVVNLAVRIENAAPPGGLLISHNTFRHVRGVFNVDPQEPISAKGFPESVPVYLVRELKPRAFRVQTRGVEGVETRMVGRDTEIKYLQDALLTAIEEGEGQVVTISGEAGVGKSRLLYEFDNWIELLPPPEVRFFQGSGRQEAQGQPYSLLRDLFAFRFQIVDGDTGEQARRKIEKGFCEVFGTEDDDFMRAHILGQLLGFDFSASPHLKGVLNDPEQLRNRARMYLVQYFQTLSKESPAVIFLEDLHWGDDSSLDMVMRLGEYSPKLHLLVVGAARPTLFERRPYWGEGQDYHTLLELHPLSKRESRQLVSEILKMVDEIPVELRELVISGAEGNPFYLEELIKMLIENGVIIPEEETWQIKLKRLEQVDVPSTLAGVLQARLDSLPTNERTVLQQASVVGRLFWDRIVAYIQVEGGNGDDPQLIPQALTSLRDRELVYRHEESAFVGAAEYLFKHDMLREVTYESVPKKVRKTYHGLVADWLIANCGDRIGEYSGLVGENLLLEGKKELAGEYFKRAGDSALAAFANTEAEKHYRQALKFAISVPSRADILSGLGDALRLQVQYEEASQVFREAIELYKELGDSNQLGSTFVNWTPIYNLIDDEEAWKICQEGLGFLAGSEDSPGYSRLLAESGRIAWLRNMDKEARLLCQRAVEMADKLGEVNVSADARITLAFLETDIAYSISTLKEVINLSNANYLLKPAARAYVNLSYFHAEYMIDYAAARRYALHAAEFATKSGDPEIGTILPYSNALEPTVFLGKIDQAEHIFCKIFLEQITPGSLKEHYSQVNHARILVARGEWEAALKIIREIIREDQLQESYMRMGTRNIELVIVSLELNRFGLLDDLTEAESALMKNLEIDHRPVQSNYLLSTVYVRQGRLSEAHIRMAQQMEDPTINGRENNRRIASRAMAEAELALAEEHWTEAMAACISAIDVFKECGHKLWWARQLIDLGDAYIGRGETGDLKQARETYQHSLELFTEMGAPGYINLPSKIQG